MKHDDTVTTSNNMLQLLDPLAHEHARCRQLKIHKPLCQEVICTSITKFC